MNIWTSSAFVWKKQIAPILLTLFLVTGCTGTYGHLRRSASVADTFHSGTVLTDYLYYYSGPDAAPDAILGIHKSFTLESQYWKAVDLDESRLNQWVSWINPFGLPYTGLPYGYVITDDTGKQIGVWYSKHRQISIELFEDNRITISLPRDVDVEFRLMRDID